MYSTSKSDEFAHVWIKCWVLSFTDWVLVLLHNTASTAENTDRRVTWKDDHERWAGKEEDEEMKHSTQSGCHWNRIIATITCSMPVNRLTPKDSYMGRTAPLTSKRCILYIYSTNVGTEYFKHALYSPFLSLQDAVCFIMLTCLVPVLFTFYIQSVVKLTK